MWNFLFWKIIRIAFRNKSYKLLFSRRCSNCLKSKIVHNFLITNPMEWIKAFHIDKNIIYEKKIQKSKNPNFEFFCCPLSLVLSLAAYLDITFSPRHWLKTKLYSCEDNQFFYLLKKFQKIMTTNQSIGTCPKFHLSYEGTMVL